MAIVTNKLLANAQKSKNGLHFKLEMIRGSTYHIEHSCQRSPHVVKRHAHKLETKVVEGDHAHKYDGQGQCLKQTAHSNITLQPGVQFCD